MDYSVVVAGGGPAGALAALRLARSGARVLVIDRARPARAEAAEILSPEGHELLVREGLWNLVPLDLTWPCTALGVAWEDPDPVWTSFSMHPRGCAWHVDRIRFDEWLRRQMRSEGVDVERGTIDATQRNSDGWRIGFSTGDRRRWVSAQCLVLATGRSSCGLRLAPRLPIDNLCLLAGTSPPDPVDPDALIVEAVADGWWYSAPLVTGRLFTGWMTDFSLVANGRYEEAAAASLAGAPLHARRIGNPQLRTVIGSATWELSPAAGPGWIAVGDAALARDPISGDGLVTALRSALSGADVVMRALQGDGTVWARAAAEAEDVARQYRRRRLDLYRVAARRWPEAEFWKRRLKD